MSKGIYRIYNKIINKTYVGKSIDIDSRKYQHFNDLINGVHNNSQLQKDYNEYGKQNFEFEILETVEDDNKLDYLEDYYIKKYDALVNGYNQCRGNIKSVLKENNFKDTPLFTNGGLISKNGSFTLQEFILWHNSYFNENIGFHEFKKIYSNDNATYSLKTSSNNFIKINEEDIDTCLYKYKIFLYNVKIPDQYVDFIQQEEKSWNDIENEWFLHIERRCNVLRKGKMLDHEHIIERECLINKFKDAIKKQCYATCKIINNTVDYEILYSLVDGIDDELDDCKFFDTVFSNIKEVI